MSLRMRLVPCHEGVNLVVNLNPTASWVFLQPISLHSQPHFFNINQFSLGSYLHVCQFTMPYPCCIILLNPITQKMFPYVIYYLSSPIQTVNTRTQIFSILIQSSSFQGKFQELFNPFLIHRAHATCINPTSIHLITLWYS